MMEILFLIEIKSKEKKVLYKKAFFSKHLSVKKCIMILELQIKILIFLHQKTNWKNLLQTLSNQKKNNNKVKKKLKFHNLMVKFFRFVIFNHLIYCDINKLKNLMKSKTNPIKNNKFKNSSNFI